MAISLTQKLIKSTDGSTTLADSWKTRRSHWLCGVVSPTNMSRDRVGTQVSHDWICDPEGRTLGVLSRDAASMGRTTVCPQQSLHTPTHEDGAGIAELGPL
jgi:hypothetical protein